LTVTDVNCDPPLGFYGFPQLYSWSHFTQLQHRRPQAPTARGHCNSGNKSDHLVSAATEFTDRKRSVRLLLAAEMELQHDVAASDQIHGARDCLSFILGIHGPTARWWIEEEVRAFGHRFDQLVPLQIFDCHLHASGAL